MFTGQGVEKQRRCKEVVLSKIKQGMQLTRDILLLESRQYALKHKERKKRKYTKQKADYWESAYV